jgi:hypothetical protein
VTRRDGRIRAIPVPEPADYYGHQGARTGTANGRRAGHAQVGPLRKTTF